MSIVNGIFSLTCSKCGKQHDFEPEDTDFELNSSEEKPMGPELGYGWEHTFNCDIDNCDNEIDVNYEIWHYPPNSNVCTDNVNITGGTEISRFGYDFLEDEEN